MLVIAVRHYLIKEGSREIRDQWMKQWSMQLSQFIGIISNMSYALPHVSLGISVNTFHIKSLFFLIYECSKKIFTYLNHINDSELSNFYLEPKKIASYPTCVVLPCFLAHWLETLQGVSKTAMNIGLLAQDPVGAQWVATAAIAGTNLMFNSILPLALSVTPKNKIQLAHKACAASYNT